MARVRNRQGSDAGNTRPMTADALQSDHDSAVKTIQAQVKAFHSDKRQFRVYHGSTSSTRAMQFRRDAVVDISGLNRLFPVDQTAMTVRAEPNVPMDVLVAHTLAAGCVPKVVMEFKGITCGGGFAGFSGESSTFKHGMFGNAVSEIEIILGDGSLEYAGPERNSELFNEAHGSLGTFGVITLVTVQLVPARSHVEIQILPLRDPLTVPSVFADACKDPKVDYIDGIYFNRESAVVMKGRMVDYADRQPDATLLTTKQTHWFADAIEAHLKTHNNPISMLTNAEETTSSYKSPPVPQSKAAVPPILTSLTDYLFRFDHGAFWGAKLAFAHYHLPHNRLTHYLADPFLASRTCYQALHRTGLANMYIVQDFAMVSSAAAKFMRFIATSMPQCQMFLCPAPPASSLNLWQRANPSRLGPDNRPLSSDLIHEPLMAVGVYGKGPKEHSAFVALNRAIEAKAASLWAVKMLYARTYYTPEEFWAIYDKARYDSLRAKYKADGLPSVFEKLAADMSGLRPRRSIRGLLETVWDVKVAKKGGYLFKK